MRNRVGLILILALVSGLTAAYLAFRFLRQPTVAGTEQSSEPAAIQVAMATRDLPAGALLSSEDVHMVAWPATNLPDGFARDLSEVVGRGLTAPVQRNEPILSTKIMNPELGNGLPLTIPQGMRAQAVRVNEVSGVAGWLHAGQRVDVIVTLDQGAQLNEPTSQMILQDLLVARIGQQTEMNDQNEAQMVTVVTLIVSPDEAQSLTLAEDRGTIRLVLRNPLDRDTVSLQGIRARELITGRRVVSSGGSARAPARPVSRSVEIIQGTQSEKQDVNGGSGGGGR